ncbi:CRS1 / YhbY (CRM) domain-containing protein [Actinidia rufa]|uniref:CRS1 / YhbY (CRM) domain-containing protein n=1 Tax=Actinidia rufa TaxID=165716 RepID=A0A7J0F5T9_9ERIC|nr:CRS1 / YhbY (CRM) domain-containing protein [Actinidia rufa]
MFMNQRIWKMKLILMTSTIVEIDETQIGFSKKKAITPFGNKKIDGFRGHFEDNVSSNVQESKNLESEVNFYGNYNGLVEIDETPIWFSKKAITPFGNKKIDGFHGHFEDNVSSNVQESKNLESEVNFNGTYKGVVEIDETPIWFSKKKAITPFGNKKIDGFMDTEDNVSSNVQESKILESEVNFKESIKELLKLMKTPTGLSEKKAKLPIEDVKRPYFVQCGDRMRNGNTMSVEKLILETELKRLRNVALRIVKRIKVGVAGVTQALVDSIHEKWKEDEVVKLKFEGPPSINMKRTREILESRTGGFNTEIGERAHLLDDLGPRFKDWSGREPLPVDSKLLPSVAPGYKLPFRLLPYGITTWYKRQGNDVLSQNCKNYAFTFCSWNRQLRGLAMAMVKLWERSVIAKIAIKCGVQNTCNERTRARAQGHSRGWGGTITLPPGCSPIVSNNTASDRSHNWDNDFLPPVVRETMVEGQEETALQQDEEDQAQWKASTLIHSNTEEASEVRLVAGTLAETMAAIYLEKKLSLAKGKIKKAEKTLENVQESLEPAEFPTDVETICDEERLCYYTLPWEELSTSRRPRNLLTRRQALAWSNELQNREALKHHVSDLTERIEKLKSEPEDTKTVYEIDEETFYSGVDDASS